MGSISIEERLKYLLDAEMDVDVPGLTREQKDVLLRLRLEDQEREYRSYGAQDPRLYGDEVVNGIVKGAIDVHCHGGSDPIARLVLEDQTAIDYTRLGMRAVVIKTHYTPSASRVPVLQKFIDRWAKENGLEPVRVFGGICLNRAVGGINPDAVRWASRFPGCKYVWMPSMDSYDHRIIIYGEDPRTAAKTGVNVLDEKGEIRAEMREILKVVAEKNMVLATSHLIHPTRKKLIEAAKDEGVEKVEVQEALNGAAHPCSATIPMMKEYVKMGVKRMTLGAMGIIAAGPIPAVEGRDWPYRAIKEVGPEHFVFGSDYGQIFNPPHHIGVTWFVKTGIYFGLTPDDLTKVMKENAKPMLDLE